MILFENQGNDCYLNSVLQMLINLVPINYFFLNSELAGSSGSKIMEYFQIICQPHLTISHFKSKYLKHELSKHFPALFQNNDQQDSHEAIVSILDIIHNLTKHDVKYMIKDKYSQRMDHYEVMKSFEAWETSAKIFGYSFITEYFTGQFKNLVICKNLCGSPCGSPCGYQNITFENFNNISVSTSSQYSSIIDCLKDFVKFEKLDDATCEKCGQKNLWKKTCIWKFPPVIIISLKRFVFTQRALQALRCNSEITINEVINFNNNGVTYKYGLSSFINHHGACASSGHYNCVAKQNQQWIMLDDSKWYPAGNLQNYSKKVYLLCYYLENVK